MHSLPNGADRGVTPTFLTLAGMWPAWGGDERERIRAQLCQNA